MSPLDVGLTDLIARLDADLGGEGDLARISEAHLRAQTLSDLGDQLIGHYVDRAKRAGASWSEIGEAIGVSKQAAQQRHAPGPFDRFSELGRHSIVVAQEAARTHKHEFISTEHLLLGVLGEPRGLAHQLLRATAGSEQRVRDAITEALPPPGKKAPRGHIPFHQDSKDVIEQARRASTELGGDLVGTEHVLLALIRAETTPAARILRTLGLTPTELLETIGRGVTERGAARVT